MARGIGVPALRFRTPSPPRHAQNGQTCWARAMWTSQPLSSRGMTGQVDWDSAMKQAATRNSGRVPYIAGSARCTSETREQAVRRKARPFTNGGSRRRRKIASQRTYTWQIGDSEVKGPAVMRRMGENTLRWLSDCYLRDGFLRPHTQTDYMRWRRLAPDRAPTLSRVREPSRCCPGAAIDPMAVFIPGLQIGPHQKPDAAELIS